MRNSRFCFFTAMLAVTVFMATSTKSHADFLPDLYGDNSPSALYKTYNNLFGTDYYSSNAALALTRLTASQFSGTFEASEINIYLLAATPGLQLGPPYYQTYYNINSYLTIFGETPSTVHLNNLPILSKTPDQPFGEKIFYYNNGNMPNESFNLLMAVTDDPEHYNALYFSNPDPDNGGFQNIASSLGENYTGHNFIYFDVTALMQANFSHLGFAYNHAYLVGYEAIYQYQIYYDGDYNDAVFLVFTNDYVRPEPPPSPEPATLLLWLLGGTGLAGTTWLRKRNKKKLALA